VKNPDVLIEAFADLLNEFPDSKLILGGSGELIPTMKNLVNELKLNEAVTFLGNLSRQEVATTLARIDAYCQSSNYETFSIICVEALAVGRPVIATKIGGMVDFIDETNGILVPEPTKEAWFNAMKKMILAYDQFDLEKISSEICNRYNSKTISTLYFNELVH
jgi:glycosyltransferase involved in cell wall biosynthesis